MNKDKFRGIFPALLTPYHADGSINEQSVARIIDMNIAKGVNGFYVGGSTGEGIMLSTEERCTLFSYAAKANRGRSTMIAHVGAIATEQAVTMARFAESAGYDAISAVAPYYFAHSAEAIAEYYRDIAAATQLPVIIYNFPASCGYSLTKQMAAELFRDEKFLGIKHTTQDLYALQQFKTLGEDIIVYNGYDEMLLAGLCMGADGGIGSTYNFMAEKFVRLRQLFCAQQLREAMQLQTEINAIIAELIRYGVFACEKYLLELMGIPMGGCKKPFLPLSSEGKQAMQAIYAKL